MALRSWGYRALLMLALVACGGRSPVGLSSDNTYGAAASGGAAAWGGGGTAGGLGGGAAARGGTGAVGGASGGTLGDGSGGAGALGGGASGGAAAGGASGTSGAEGGGSAGTVPNLADDASLRSLTVEEGYLSPKFAPDGFRYTLTVPRGTKLVTVEAVPNDPDATVEVGDSDVSDGAVQVSIEAMPYEFPVVVTAPSGSRSTTYLSFYEELVESTTYVKPSRTEEFAQFGISVAVSGDTLAVGAYAETAMTASGQSGPVGAVYVYVKDNDGWQEQAYLQPSSPKLYEQFGYAVALSGDTLVIGAPGANAGLSGDDAGSTVEGAGAAHVFVREDGTWTEQAQVTAAEPEPQALFGVSVALEGDTLVVGASGQSRAPVDRSGSPLSFAGEATVLVREGTSWSVQKTLGASNPSVDARFGSNVALSGDRLVVSAVGEGSGIAGVAGSEPGSVPWSGAVYTFARSGATWEEEAFLKAPNPAAYGYFGNGVALSGERLVVGASGERGPFDPALGAITSEAGAAYVFQRGNDHWDTTATLLPSNGGQGHHFGARLASDDELIVVSAPGETGSSSGVNGDPFRAGAQESGAVYVFARENRGTWSQREYLKAVTSDPNDGFGVSVSLADGELAVGAYGESSHATGIDGDSANDSVQGAGAAYVYELSR